MPTARIKELAQIISTNAASIDSYLETNGYPSLSFDETAPSALFANEDLDQSRSQVVEAARELADLMQPPTALLMDQAVGR